MKKKNLRSEAAIRGAIEFANKSYVDVVLHKKLTRGRVTDIVLYVVEWGFPSNTLCAVSLKDHIKKRKPLTGVNKKLKEIVRGTKAKKRK